MVVVTCADMNHVAIRRARPEDYDEACRLFDIADQIHRDRLPWLFAARGLHVWSREFFDGLLAGDESALFVADCGGLVGLAHGSIRHAPDSPVFVRQHWGVVDGVVVDPVWRRRGIGRALTTAVERWALDLGASWIELNVYEFNDEAVAFYRSLGYLQLSAKMRKPREGSV
jgi:ribosomal protein S18 acetylase RimI-like enzyme